jgi:phosphotransferase system HPr (HPr) family protein
VPVSNLVLSSPLEGWIAPLDETPDAVFAERMLGDGLAIDPLGSTLHAPCDARVIAVHATRHAVTLRADNGAEILMHVGLETVGLGGEGFEVHVENGQAVKAGDKLISFDLDLLSQRAKSLITPVVITNPDAFQIVRREQDHSVLVGDFLMELAPVGGAGAVLAVAEGEVSREVVVPLQHGIHARPAARIAESARKFASEVALVAVNRRASAKSPVGVMSLAARHGDRISIVASGADADFAVAAIVELIEGGMGESAALPPTAAAVVEAVRAAPPSEPGLLRGVMAAPGLAIGQAVRLVSSDIVVSEAGAGMGFERGALDDAIGVVRIKIEKSAAKGDTARKAILGAHLAFLEDPELTAAAHRLIADGKSAGFSWRRAVGGYVEALRGLGDRRLAERVDDLIDLERQVLRALSGEEDDARVLPPGAILLADELLPSQLMGLEAGQVAGFCTAKGGPTSHVAILAAAMGIPALVAAGPGVLDVTEGAGLILDAENGTLRVGPDAGQLAAAQTAIAARHERKAAAKAAAHQESRTADGARIEVFGNVGSLNDALAAAANGRRGLRPAAHRVSVPGARGPPDEDEQARQYQAIASALDGRPLIIRTLDVGGDKAAALPADPGRGEPGVGPARRARQPVAPAPAEDPIAGHLPRQTAGTVQDHGADDRQPRRTAAVRAMLDETKREMVITERVELGVMIETPAAAVTADLLAAEIDFLSIGTNDLTQYVLAMDRGNPELAARWTPCTPPCCG